VKRGLGVGDRGDDEKEETTDKRYLVIGAMMGLSEGDCMYISMR